MRSYRSVIARLAAAAGILAVAFPLLASPPASAQPDIGMYARQAAAETYLRLRPGITGYVLRDRVSGVSYVNGGANTRIWTASTIKLAIAADLLRRARAGSIQLSGADRDLIGRMLRASDNNAADILWRKYAGADHQDFQRGFRALGMRDVTPQPGFHPAFEPYWGFEKTSAADFDRLLDYVLNRANAADKGYLLDQLRRVDRNQHWGVWGMGPQSGVKNGWSEEDKGWVVSSVGFTGQGEPRYTLAIMNDLQGRGDFGAGRATVTEVARILLAGR